MMTPFTVLEATRSLLALCVCQHLAIVNIFRLARTASLLNPNGQGR